MYLFSITFASRLCGLCITIYWSDLVFKYCRSLVDVVCVLCVLCVYVSECVCVCVCMCVSVFECVFVCVRAVLL